MNFQMILRKIKRSLSRSVLTIGIAVCLILFAGVYFNNITQTKDALKELADTSHITGQITDMSGKKQVGLEILPATFNRIKQSENVKNPVYTIQAAGNMEKENQVKNPKKFDTLLMATNSLETFSSLAEKDIHFVEGKSSEFFKSDKGICIVTDTYAKRHEIKEGNTVKVPMYTMKYTQGGGGFQANEVGEVSLKVVGIVSEQKLGDSQANMIVPARWFVEYMEKTGKDFFYDSLRFQIKNPMELNSLKKEMKKIGLSEKNTEVLEGTDGGTLVIDDTVFIDSAERLYENLTAFKKFEFPFLVLVGILAVVTTFLLTRSRRLEIAVALSLGQKKRDVALQLFVEIGILNMIGSIAGVFLLLIFTNMNGMELFKILGIFVLVVIVGIIIGLKLLFRFDVMTMLTKVD
ncbi:MAG: hypothetical protein E6686_02915 [Lachnospiraceae bacterium]|nr:hypothetical protein [Lachnospiraceae bacterium]